MEAAPVTVFEEDVDVDKPQRVQVKWRDVTCSTKTWQRGSKLKPDARKVRSIGWLVYEDERSIMLAQDWDFHEGNFSGVATYPRGMVEEITLLGLAP